MLVLLLVFNMVASGFAVADENYGTAIRYIGGDQSAQVSRAIRGRSEVWVVVQGGDRFKIRRPVALSSGLGYEMYGEGGEIPWHQLRAVQTRSSAAGTGATVGGLALGAVGLGVGLAFSKDCSAAGFLEPCGASTGDVLLVTAVGAGAGALLGAAIGAMIPSYKTIYRSAGFIGFRPTIEPGSGSGRPVYGLEVRLAPGP
jgi:hypothetical protein